MSIYPDEIQNKYTTLKFKFFLIKIFIIILLSILSFVINYFPKTESFQKSEFKDAKENPVTVYGIASAILPRHSLFSGFKV